jgi:hypothetical protein
MVVDGLDCKWEEGEGTEIGDSQRDRQECQSSWIGVIGHMEWD